MTHTTVLELARKGLFVLLALILVASFTDAQDLILNGDQTNNGTIRVRRDIINNTTGTVTVSGTGVVRLDRNTDDHLIRSASGSYPIVFSNLSMTQNRPVTALVDVTVTNNLTIGDASNPYTNATGFSIGSRTLTIQNTSSYLATSTAPLVFSGGTVNYTASSGTQTVLVANSGTTYGTLNLSGNANMTVPDAPEGVFSVATLSHTGSGSLTVNDSATVTTTASIGTLATVASGKVFNIAGTSASSIGTVTTIAGTLRNSVAQDLGITTVSGNTGTIENTAGGTMTITTLSANDGTIRNTAAGILAFTNAAASNGTIANTSTGLLDFANNLSGTGTITNNGGGTVEFGGSLAQNTYNLNSGTVIYNSGSAQNVVGTTYNNLTLNNSAKTLAAAATVNGNLTLDASSALDMNNNNVSLAGNLVLGSNVTTGSGVLTMTSTTANNVSGSGEVRGAVRRNHNFTAGQNYLFNRPDVYIGTATTAGTDITLAMSVATDPTSPATTKYIQRKYALTPTTAGNLQAIQLYYAAGEPQGGINEAKIGLRVYNGTSWAKVTNPGQTRTSGSNLMTYSGLNNSLAGATELGMYGIDFRTYANNANISTAAGWDENQMPDNTDDATIAHTGVVTGAAPVSVATLTINSGADLTTANALGTLTVATTTDINGTLNVTTANANLAAITVGSAGVVSVGNGMTLTGTSYTNNSGSTSTFTGNVSLASLAHNGNSGAGTLNFNGSNSTISGAVTNVAGTTISVGGTLNIMISSALTLSSAGNITINGGTLNVGASGVASNLTMTTPSTLTLSTGTSYLNVYGNLELGAGATLNNSGEIIIGE